MTVANLNAFALEQGMKKTVETMSEAEKTQLRYNFILEKTAFFAGDARDTIGSTANQLKKLSGGFTNLKTNIGYLLDGSTNIVLQKVNAQIEKMVAHLDKLVVKGKELDDSFKNALYKEKEGFKIKLGTDETFEKFNKFLKTYKDSLARIGVDASKIGNDFSMLYLEKARGKVGGENVLDKFIIKFMDELYNTKVKTKTNLTGLEKEDNLEMGNGSGNAKEKVLTLSELQAQYNNSLDSAKQYATFMQLTEEEKNRNILGLQEGFIQQALDNNWDSYAKQLSLEALKTKVVITGIETQQKSLDDLNKSYDEAPQKIQDKIQAEKNLAEEQIKNQDDVFKTLSSATNQEELKTGMEELIGKYSGQGAVIDYLNEIYPEFLKNLGKEKVVKKDLSKSISDVADLTGELASLFDDDLLGAMSNVLNGISSSIQGFGSGNMLQGLTSAIGVVGTVANALDWTKNVNAEAQNEANENFGEAVENFKKSVDSMTLGRAISFSKLQKPVNLSSGGVNAGGIGTDLSTFLLGPVGSAILGKDIAWGADNASVDTSGLQDMLNSSGYGGIDTQAIMNKYAQRKDYIDASDWFKKKSRIVGYDTAGAMAEIQKLIDEAYDKNMENIKKALGFTHTEFANNMASVFKAGGDIATSLNDMFSNALITAFFNQEAFEILNKQMGNAMSKAVLGEMANMGLDMNLSGTFEEQMAQYAEITGASFGILNRIMKKYGITVGKTTEQMASLETKLPSGFKLALAGYNAINTTVTTGQTIVYQVENNYSKDFQEMVDTATNQSRYLSTGNLRGRGY